ncbi:hypothetical protein OCH239_21355 [Roseivivax halodurans JCM 10272]|uniref:Uncharacterized protein n=1 Tax=Roseivivax halodurans JCM 10272 TaxID=1449350 RepID=X7E4G8_9RHOB|nr:hypothetical protein OCH239_21355 [Roseivivax halodurans JCM 10272]
MRADEAERDVLAAGIDRNRAAMKLPGQIECG